MTIKSVDNFLTVKTVKSGKLTAVASTAGIDRDGEVVLPIAFLNRLDRYRANAVILAAHTHRTGDGTPTIIGRADRIAVEGDALVFEMTFAQIPIARQWQSLFEQGFAKAFSIGFIPIDGGFEQRDGQTVYVHTEVELLEISAVAVPANPEALRRGMDTGTRQRVTSSCTSMADEFERIALGIAVTDEDREAVRQAAQGIRDGYIRDWQAQDLLRKAKAQRSRAGEQQLADAVEKLCASAAGSGRS